MKPSSARQLSHSRSRRASPSRRKTGRRHSIAFFKHFSQASSLTLLSRLFGQLRVTLLATLLGASAFGDSFYLAFKFPNLLRRLFAEGSMSAAFVPIFNRLGKSKHEGKVEKETQAEDKEKKDFFALIFFFQLLAVAVTLALLGWFAPLITRFFYSLTAAPAVPFQHTTLLLRIMLPYLWFISLAAVVQGVLNSKQNFHAPATSPLLFNLVLSGIAFFLLTQAESQTKSTATIVLSLGVLVGGALQLAYLLFWSWKQGYSPLRRVSFKTPLLKRFLKLKFPVVFSAGFYQISVLVVDPIALSLEAGALSLLFYSNRLLELPLGIIGVSLSTVSLPLLAKLARQRRAAEQAGGGEEEAASLRGVMENTCALLLLFSLPVLLVGALHRQLIVSLVFQFGSFSAEDTAGAAQCLVFHLLALPAIVLYRQVHQLFFAHENTKTPMLLSAWGILLTVSFTWGLTRLYPKAAGVALATACTSLVLLLLFLWAAKRQFKIALLGFLVREAAGYALLLVPAVLTGLLFKALLSVSLSAFYQLAEGHLLAYKMLQLMELSLNSLAVLGSYGLMLYFFQKEKTSALFTKLPY